MTARWIYTTEGQAPYYQDGDYTYSKEGACRYAVSAGYATSSVGRYQWL